MTKIWFITGTSSGFGREWAEAALERGDRVVATARNTGSLADLADRFGEAVLPLELDVTDREAVLAAVQRGAAHFGGLDVVVSNAGYGHVGMVEEVTERELREELETNFFGTVWVIQAALPILRRQGRGHLVQVTSEGGVRAFPTFGAYHASKWAVEGITESLWQEVEGFGIHVTNVEPGPYATDFGGRGLRQSAEHPGYSQVRAENTPRGSPATRGRPGPRSWRSSTPRTRRTASCSAAPSRPSRRSTPSASTPGAAGSRSRSAPSAKRWRASGTAGRRGRRPWRRRRGRRGGRRGG